MADIWIGGAHQWRVHRKAFAEAGADPPDPKWWRDPSTQVKYTVRHDDGFFCDDCPPEKRGLVAPPLKAYCPPGERRFSNV